eukprot:Pgem_evm1s19169
MLALAFYFYYDKKKNKRTLLKLNGKSAREFALAISDDPAPIHLTSDVEYVNPTETNRSFSDLDQDKSYCAVDNYGDMNPSSSTSTCEYSVPNDGEYSIPDDEYSAKYNKSTLADAALYDVVTSEDGNDVGNDQYDDLATASSDCLAADYDDILNED